MGLALLLLVVLPPQARAHPHIFVDCSIKALFNAEGLLGFEHVWLFDEIFSASMLEEYDADRNAAFNSTEAEQYEREIFSLLEEYHFLTTLRLDGAYIPVSKAERFQPSVRGGKLCYSFFLPCPVPLDGMQHDVAITVFDADYYADMALPASAASVDTPGGLQVQITTSTAPDLTYFGCIVPTLIHFTFGPQ